MYVVFYAIIINEGYIKKQYSMGKTMIIKEGGELITGSQNTGNNTISVSLIFISYVF